MSDSSKSKDKSKDKDKSKSKDKTFDKKKWRQNKYSHRVRLDRWENARRIKMERGYLNMLKREAHSSDRPDNGRKASAVSYGEMKRSFDARKRKAQKNQMEEEKKVKFLEKREALKAYKKKKSEKYKLLSRRNVKGQPAMAGRIRLLLQKIQESSGNKGS